MAAMNRRELLAQSLAVGGGVAAGLSEVKSAAPEIIRGNRLKAQWYFGIHVIDDHTARGVPLVELRTVNNIRYYTDSAGYCAIEEPGLMGRQTYFFISAPGYDYPKDGFGYAGVTLDLKPGAAATIRLKRINIAERLYRVTGEGIYGDSIQLGQPVPLREPLLNGKVMGQDSVLAVIYQGRLHWIWGDTARPAYPLGNFRSSGAVSDLPGKGGLNPAVGVNLHYFTDNHGFCRAMCPLPEEPEGVVWLGGLTVVPDHTGTLRMVARYSRRAGLTKLLGHGLAIWDDRTAIFRKYKVYPLAEHWRFPTGHPAIYVDGGIEYRLFNPQFPTLRAIAKLGAIADPQSYEAFTCLYPGTQFQGNKSKLERRADGTLVWGWKHHGTPINSRQELELLTAGLIQPHEAHFQLMDVQSHRPVMIQSGSFFWNDYLKKWIMIGCQEGGTSFLGEIWFAAAAAPTGPWKRAIKIATHPNYSFYNPTQHPFFDQEGGKVIYFEGTYSVTFSGNDHPVPRYDYNQLMYRLNLSDPRLTTTVGI